MAGEHFFVSLCKRAFGRGLLFGGQLAPIRSEGIFLKKFAARWRVRRLISKISDLDQVSENNLNIIFAKLIFFKKKYFLQEVLVINNCPKHR